ncbi:phosphoketolase family protein [Quadrisphaera sp. KR29]|uniref:phosphoketolase family protein n=1 Tax=Quadrisphaera sp. KR29 TaxID=3461391 RepID=UPI0040440D9B
MVPDVLDAEALAAVDHWWRAANYLSVGQIYLQADPLLREPLSADHVKARLLGHWGTTPGLNFVWSHVNRAIRDRDTQALFVAGPGHGGPSVVANAWLEGAWTEAYPDVDQTEEGMRRLFKQFSFPGGIPSHAAADVPGSIHEGGELGYALVHATGAVFDDPDLVAVCVIGDGEAETGPLAASWHANKFLDAARDGAVLPVLHLNGYKIANPTVLARMDDEELEQYLRGTGWEPLWVSGPGDGEDATAVHQRMAQALDTALDRIAENQRAAREHAAAHDGDPGDRPRWPALVLRTPKGWTGPLEVDGQPVAGTWRAHQVPLSEVRSDEGHRAQLREWLESYRAAELFDPTGAPTAAVLANRPRDERRMSASPRTNGGLVKKPLRLPDFRGYGVDVPRPGEQMHSPTTVFGDWLRDVMAANPETFRLFGPDEVASNRLQAVFDVTDRQLADGPLEGDSHVQRNGRVMEVLSEHLCQGWLEGYLLTGRHGLFTSYEAFIHIVDSMVNQHAKWLKTTRALPWRRPLASLNYLLSSHVWRQDHNGFSHQDPGFIDHVVTKKAEITRVYLPPDANTLLSTMDHVLRSEHYVNVVVAGKQQALDYLTMDEAVAHCTRGLGRWAWASSDDGVEPDVVIACAGDIPTQEALAATAILRRRLPDLRVRFVNVVDLMRLQPASEHPHGMPDREYDALFTTDRPVLFAFHGYPTLVHRLTYRRTGHHNLHVRGFIEEGTTTTPFDMVHRNDLDRFRLVMDVIDRVPGLGVRHAGLRQEMADARLAARAHAYETGEDPEEISGFRWDPSL